MLNLGSFLLLEDREVATDHSLRTASTSVREAAKIGLQSLYADPKEVLEKYKDFDIVKEMQDRAGAKLLWVRARAIDANTVNANGDYFSKDELLKDVDVKGEKIPAYKTFEGVPMYTNHKNDDIEQAKGMVVYAEWSEEENCVYCTFFIDEEAYPDIARNIRTGVIHDVSMGCAVESGVCSECGKEATTEREYCEHMKNYKGKVNPRSGKKVYEKNKGLKFIELSCVGDGAFDTCEIEEIYDVEEVLNAALKLNEKAASINGRILIAATAATKNNTDRHTYEDALRMVSSATATAMRMALRADEKDYLPLDHPVVVRLAQAAGTLVGGQLMAGEGTNQNTTVQNILQFLGIDVAAGLNILDMLNLALNFLEVAVMNLFARKDNVDLSHVGKITKSMADLQATMQDMIDDGVDGAGGSSGGNQPINQAQLGQGQPPQAPANPAAQGNAQAQPQSYSPAGAVGRSIGPMGGAMVQPNAAHGLPLGLTGNEAFASTNSGSLIVWAGHEKDKGRAVFASVDDSRAMGSKNAERLGDSLASFIDCLSLSAQANGINSRIAESDKPTKNGAAVIKQPEGTNQMEDLFKRVASQQALKQATTMIVDIKVQDEAGNRVVLSTDGSIKAFKSGEGTAYEIGLNEDQISGLKGGRGQQVAVDLLKDFGRFASSKGSRTVVSEWEPHHEEDVKEIEIDPKRKGEIEKEVKEKMLDKAGPYKRTNDDSDGKTREELLKSKRKNDGSDGEVMEAQLAGAGLYSWRGTDDDVKEVLVEDARRGYSEEVIEEQLEVCHNNYGPAQDDLVMEAALNALGRAVVAAKVTPGEIVEAAASLSKQDNVVELLALAGLGNKHRQTIASRRKFFREASAPLPLEVALFDSLGQAVSNEVTAADVSEVLVAVAGAQGKATETITRIARALLDDESGEAALAGRQATRSERLRAVLATSNSETSLHSRASLGAALKAMAYCVREAGLTPKEVVAAASQGDINGLLVDVEVARSAESVNARLTNRERRDFHGSRLASKVDVRDELVGWIVDVADAKGVGAADAASAARFIASNNSTALRMITKAAQAMDEQSRTAEVTLRDEKVTTKTVECRMEDLGGLSIKDEGFEGAFRDKCLQVFAESGFQVDPNTFSLTEVTASEDGMITGVVRSSFTRSFKANSGDAQAGMGLEASFSGGQSPEDNPTPAMPIDQSVQDSPEMPMPDDEPQVLATAAAKAYRKAKRKDILSRYAQGMPAPSPMGAGAPGADATGAGGAPADGLGIGSLGAPPSDLGGNPAEPAPDADSMSEPGTKQPWGTICPQCGSDNVSTANGKGTCNSCNANLDFKFSVEVSPASDEQAEEGKDGEKGAEPDMGMGMDAGLGAATAPSAGAPAGDMGGAGAPPAAGGMPGVMAQVSYLADSDVFLRTAMVDYDAAKEKRLPVGFVCPGCGNRKASKVDEHTICYNCSTWSKSDIEELNDGSGRVACTITWL